ncbi:hypothetical protein EBB07_13535 [Paenibacillaceae bacterium]|nr:hypothetical protein EBB07_13535 [Paenibacillaceae bacterium]
MLKKTIAMLLVVILVGSGVNAVPSHSVDASAVAKEEAGVDPFVQKRIHKIQQMPRLPEPFDMKNWRETAIDYDAFVFDFTKQGDYLPVGWWDRTHHNMDEDTFGLMTYVGKFSQGTDGSQEAINLMAAVLSATLVGIDKSDQDGIDYVKMLQTFYNADNGENMIMNNPSTVSGQTFWYELLPHVLFYALASYYPDVDQMDEMMRSTADKWAEAVQVLGGQYGRADFQYTAFDFHKMAPFRNERWTEPDAAAGVAMLQYMAYAKYGDAKYLDAAVLSMDFLERQQDNPLYEVLLYHAPYMAAKMNAEQGKDYDVDKMMNWVFDGGSRAREGWGTIAEKWGDYDVHGLLGSLNDNGGYAFAMNTFAAFGALAPVVRYDPRYARDIGKWMLNAANQSRLFYADHIPADHQSGADWKGDPQHVIPYEGLRKELNGKTPYASGDPTVYGWGNTDFSLYSGSYAGFMGGLIEETNIEGILKIDTLKTDYFHREAYPTYLYYNPHETEHIVEMDGLGDSPVDLFDTVSGSFIVRNAKGQASITLAGDQAAVIAVVPAGAAVTEEEQMTLIDGVYVSPAAKPAVNILGLQKRELVAGTVEIALETGIPAKHKLESLTVAFAGQELFSGAMLPDKLELDTTQFNNGFHRLKAEVITSGGAKDSTEIELFVRNAGGESIIAAGPEQLSAWEPIEAMPGSAQRQDGKVKVMETNDAGGYGGVTSPTFELDFSRRPFAIVDVASASPQWALQLHVKGEPWGFYVKPDGTETGHFILDVMKELRRMHPDMAYLGVQEVELWLIAAGQEGAYAEFEQIDLFYQDDVPLSEEQWSTPFDAAAIAEWQQVPALQGSVIFDGKAAVIQEDALLNRGGVSSPYMNVDVARNPTLTVDVTDATDEWSVMLYIRGQNEGIIIQPPVSESGRISYSLADYMKGTQGNSESGFAEVQVWLLAEGNDDASFSVSSVELAYGDKDGSPVWVYVGAAVLAIAVVLTIGLVLRSRRRTA